MSATQGSRPEDEGFQYYVRLRIVYYDPRFVRDGGLIAYGPDIPDFYRRAAPYVDHILRGEKPADLPVQLAVKFDMAVNMKAANALGLSVPPFIMVRTDEVIE